MKLPVTPTLRADGELAVDVTSLLFRIGKRHRIVASAVVAVTGTAITAMDCDGCSVARTAIGTFTLQAETVPTATAWVAAIPLSSGRTIAMNGPHVAGAFPLDMEDDAGAAADGSFLALVLDTRGGT